MAMFEEAGMASPELVSIEEAYKNVKELEEPQNSEVDKDSFSDGKKESAISLCCCFLGKQPTYPLQKWM